MVHTAKHFPLLLFEASRRKPTPQRPSAAAKDNATRLREWLQTDTRQAPRQFVASLPDRTADLQACAREVAAACTDAHAGSRVAARQVVALWPQLQDTLCARAKQAMTEERDEDLRVAAELVPRAAAALWNESEGNVSDDFILRIAPWMLRVPGAARSVVDALRRPDLPRAQRLRLENICDQTQHSH